MSTLHKVKAYFGMAPMEDYDDEYYDDDDERGAARGYARRGERFAEDGYDRVGSRYEGREYDDPRGEPADYPPGSYRGGYGDEPRFRPREFDRPASRFGSL